MPEVRTRFAGRQVGAFGGLGGEIISMGWEPPNYPEDDEQALLIVAGYLDNVEMPLLASLGIAREDTERRFTTETDPDGTPWHPLDEEYLAKKTREGYPEDILHRDGDLEETAPSGWKIVGNTLFYDASGLPDYALAHQSGSGNSSDWGLAADHRTRIKALRTSGTRGPEHKGDYGHASLDIGRGNALPPRPFIGLSIIAVEEMAVVFDAWFDEAVEVFYNPRTRIMQERGPGGRFGARVR